jgi:glycosyltransferase involved in cell wall biosynthesis
VNGLVIPPDDLDSLEEAMDTLLSDGNLCDQMSTAAKLSAMDFSEEKMVNQIEKVYNECLNPLVDC